MIAVKIYISGKVQGVGFRSYTKKIAEGYGLVGYVKNLPDGRVEVFTQGNEDIVWSFIKDVWKGPRLSQVGSISIVKEVPDDKIYDFRIDY